MAYEYRHHHAFGAVAMVISLSLFASAALRVSAANVTSARDTLSRETASATATHAVTINVGATLLSGVMQLNYPGFSGFSAFTSGSACVTAPTNPSGTTIEVALAGCTGSISFGFSAVNPGATASNFVTISGVATGGFAVPTVANDTISVTATVDPTITFDVGATASACDGTFASSNWNVSLGLLNAARLIASSDVASVSHICTLLSTNASGGAVVTAKNANGANGLVSTSVPADKIPSLSAAITDSSSNYGLCYTATRGHNASSVPASNAPSVATSVFSNAGGNCTSSVVTGAESVAAFSGSVQEVFRTVGVTDRAFVTLFVKAGISATQASHNDYADSITFAATATF